MTEITRRLEDKVAIVTGASQGIGAGIARRFAQEGATVILAARNEASLNKVAEEIAVAGGKALVVVTDVGNASAIENLVKRTVDTYGRLNMAVNNAGFGHRQSPLADLTLESFETTLRVNLTGTFLSMKYQIPAMLASGGGSIVNMASTAGVRGVPGLSDYVAAKHGVIGLSKSAALEYASQNIRVNVIAPGPILNDSIASLTDEQRQPIKNAVPMKRIGLPDDVAAAALWLCTAESAFVTGAVLNLDGGQTAGPSF